MHLRSDLQHRILREKIRILSEEEGKQTWVSIAFDSIPAVCLKHSHHLKTSASRVCNHMLLLNNKQQLIVAQSCILELESIERNYQNLYIFPHKILAPSRFCLVHMHVVKKTW